MPTPSEKPGRLAGNAHGRLAGNSHGRLAGKVAIITGAARGQGAAEAQRFASEGASVVITDVLDTDAKALAGEIGEAALALAHDVSSEADWATVVRTATETFGGVDILVNNAAIYWTRPLVDEPVADFERLLRVNLVGALLGLQAVVPAMKARGGGSIVNISSLAGTAGMYGHGAYGMSKWGLRGLTQVAATELGVEGIRVNAVLPGSIDTAMLPVPKADFGTRFQDLPLGRVGTANEIAEAVLFLASDESSYLTGSELRVDGGLGSGRRPEAWRVDHLPG
ncbi:MAG TPA: glucose 1-dehydrogenase [Frankiaceae bacterium]|nr:glucose 1-dehydrogenase [Frankiaceae bacterium]